MERRVKHIPLAALTISVWLVQTLSSWAQLREQITAEQVRAVAKKYLVNERLTTAILEPQQMDTAGRNS